MTNLTPDAIYDAYYSMLYVFVVKLIVDKEEAKDIVLKTFMKLFDRLEKFENSSDIKGFLFTTCKHAALNYLRGLKRDNKRHIEYATEIAWLSDTEQAQIQGYVWKGLYKHLAALPRKSGEVIRLLFFEKLSNQEAADQLKVSVATVKSQRRYALDLLKEYVDLQQLNQLYD